MLAAAQMAMVLSCTIVSYVGVRTLLVWNRTLRIPELLIGVNVLGAAVSGTLLIGLGVVQPTADTAMLRVIVYWIGMLSAVSSVFALYLGNWLIYRPADRWPILLVAVGGGLILLWAATGNYGSGNMTPARSILLSGVRGLGMGWATWECFRWSGMLRRRVGLGLAEPMMAHRIWLWGVGALSQVFAASLNVIGTVWWEGAFETPMGLFSLSLLALASGACVALAFFPPLFYVRLIVGPTADAVTAT